MRTGRADEAAAQVGPGMLFYRVLALPSHTWPLRGGAKCAKVGLGPRRTASLGLLELRLRLPVLCASVRMAAWGRQNRPGLRSAPVKWTPQPSLIVPSAPNTVFANTGFTPNSTIP